MKTKCITLVALLLAGFVLSASAWDMSAKPSRIITYKKVGDLELKLHVFDPPAETKEPMPAIVFFFGGGWTGGESAQFYHQANYLARHGFLAISADYRTMSNGKAAPDECVKELLRPWQRRTSFSRDSAGSPARRTLKNTWLHSPPILSVCGAKDTCCIYDPTRGPQAA